MPSEFELNLSSPHTISEARQQLEEQRVPRGQADKVLAKCEWHADRTAHEAGSTPAEITPRLPGKPSSVLSGDTDSTRTSHVNGHSFLFSILNQASGPHLSPDLKKRAGQLLAPIVEGYQMTVCDDTDLDKLQALLEQEVSLESLQGKDIHVRRADNTLVFKRYASSSGRLHKFLSRHETKTERGQALLKTVLSRPGGNLNLLKGFSTVCKNSIDNASVISPGRTPVATVEWPSRNQITKSLLSNGDDLSSLRLPIDNTNLQISNTVSELVGLRFLIDDDSQIGKLCDKFEHYHSLCANLKREEVATFVTNSVGDKGGFNPDYANLQICDLVGKRLQRELPRLTTSPIETGAERLKAVKELVKAGISTFWIQEILVNFGNMSRSDFRILLVPGKGKIIELSELESLQGKIKGLTRTIEELPNQEKQLQTELEELNKNYEKLETQYQAMGDLLRQAGDGARRLG